MMKMTRIWDRLYLGGFDDAQLLAQSNPSGITTVVSLCEDRVLRRDSSINYLHIPIVDAKCISVRKFDTITDAVGENIRWGTVLLHCGGGISRAPIMTAAWMHVVGYKDIDRALAEIAGLRPIIAPSEILLSSVRGYLR